jgi:integrase
MSKPEKQKKGKEGQKTWQFLPDSHLVRYVSSGTYFARVKVHGKIIRKSLRTEVLSVARLRVADFVKEQKAKPSLSAEPSSIKEVSNDFLERSAANYRIKPRTKQYHRECVATLESMFPKFFAMQAGRVTKGLLAEIAGELNSKYSATRFNGMISVVKAFFKIAIETGVRHDNPAADLQRAKVRKTELERPSQAQFERILEYLEMASPEGAFLVQFLAFSGCRIDEARYVTWDDIEEGTIVVRGHPETGTKNSETRRVPIISPMEQLLKGRRPKKAARAETLLKIKGCRKALIHACEFAKIPPLSHHDFRHLFATKCIESGVDIPTISHWLGHKDGGALAMKTYGHLRDEHSRKMAERVSF